jgi:hypothetical protein
MMAAAWMPGAWSRGRAEQRRQRQSQGRGWSLERAERSEEEEEGSNRLHWLVEIASPSCLCIYMAYGINCLCL